MNLKSDLTSLQGKKFDVAVIGAGMNGASAAQQLTAAGYSVLLVDKGDFSSGSSSKSGRQLHCGLRYLAPGRSIWDFVVYPSKFFVATKMARLAMLARSECVSSMPERLMPYQCAFPVYRNSIYRRWQTEIAFRLLKALGGSDVPLDYKWHAPSTVDQMPLARWLRDRDQMLGVATYREYQFNWPERICVDMSLDAQRMGAEVRNYTGVNCLLRAGDGWDLQLVDVGAKTAGQTATVFARRVLNMTGVWIDEVNSMAVTGAKRRVTGTKGVYIMVQMPPECEGHAVHTFNRENEGYSCVPFRGMHVIGPTETVFEGNANEIRAEDNEIDFLIDETNYIFPSLKLSRSNIYASWAGVRPLGADEAYPKGKRDRETHDLSSDGMPGVFAMTAGPIMTHRSAGRELVDVIASQISPSRQTQSARYDGGPGRPKWDRTLTPTSLNEVSEALMTFVTQNEQVERLPDAMFRRLGLGWSSRMGYDDADRAAKLVGDALGWDESRVAAEASGYRRFLETSFNVQDGHRAKPLNPR